MALAEYFGEGFFIFETMALGFFVLVSSTIEYPISFVIFTLFENVA